MATNWWVHRFISGGNASYLINHVAFMIGEDMRSPDNDVGYVSIAITEAALGTMGIENGLTWYIHRTGKHGSATKTYTIDHSSSNSSYNKTCPGSPPGYATIQALAEGGKLSYFHTNGSCG